MTKRQEIRLRYFEDLKSQSHISHDDRYLYAKPEPSRTIAIIGCGTIGQEHLAVTHLLGRARVVGLFDEQRHSLEVASCLNEDLTGDKPTHFKSIEEATSSEDVDAFIIATPNHTHLSILKQVMQSGKPILLEKPMATTLADAAETVSLCNDYPSHVQVGLQYRFKAVYAEATAEIFTRQSIGQVKTLQLFEHRPPFLDKVGQWNKFSKNTGGTLTEKCCHYFDLLNHFACSQPDAVFARGSQAVNFKEFEYNGEQSDIMDNATVVIEYKNGVRANFELNMFVPNFHEEMIVCGDRGRLTTTETFNVFQTQSSQSLLNIELAETGPSRRVELGYPSFIEQSGHHGATFYEHQSFHDALDGVAQSAANVDQGFWSIVVGQAAEASAASGKVIKIDSFLDSIDLSHLVDA
ncbi:MAG: Gfo/Idh/MocA family oxidoreductase [Pseudomonadota bacterium]